MLKAKSELGHTLFDVVYPPDYLELRGVTPQEVALATDPQNTANQAMYATNPENFPASETDRLRFGWLFGLGYTGVGNVLTLHFKIGSDAVREYRLLWNRRRLCERERRLMSKLLWGMMES